MVNVKQSLTDFTNRYVEQWQQQTGQAPKSIDLYGIPSPCIIGSQDGQVQWLPQPANTELSLTNIEQAMEIKLHPDIHDYYTTQFAGDMLVRFNGIEISLVQVWSADDFIRLQENLIGHLFTQRRLKLTPTIFIGTIDSELELVSVSNQSGQVILEQFGSKKQQILSPSLVDFLNNLQIVIRC